jgi:2-iminobutanoate/2-iminopropanoate deaminase
MQKSKIAPAGLPPTMGAYSHSYTVDLGDTRMHLVSGQVPLDATGQVPSADVGAQTRYVFERLQTILAESGATLDDVVKVQVFLTDMADFGVVSPIRNEFFAASEPASTLVAVSALVHPDCKIEIDVVAVTSLA